MTRITPALPTQRPNIATASPVALIQRPQFTQRADTVHFGHKPHVHGPNCNHDHEPPSTEAAATASTQESSGTTKTETVKEADASPHVHGPNCSHNKPNWFRRLYTGFVNDIKTFFNKLSGWLKKLFSGKSKAEE
jgi:hypothetical protein